MSESNRPGETKIDRQNRFLIPFRESVSDAEACKAAGISRTTLYNWLRDDDVFRLDYDKADRDRSSNLEARMFNILEWATKEDNYLQVLRHPTLFIFALKGAYPEKYGDRIGLGKEEAKTIIDELMKMKDDPAPVADETATVDQQIDDILKL